ncbi:carotenoid oxygenase family protein [Thalassotalea crassostreae]|uniref:carotenoid oxygenase family protein n=1 Tax=Thalassotalea crassostreae TaxID=1763536 RepID=UPI00083887A3|nr:carotenoid oxygenase family protein [Thalassotalea crassostreae]
MQRRELLKSIGLASVGVGASIAMPKALGAAATKSLTKSPKNIAVNFKELFNQALAKDPDLIGFANVEHDFDTKSLQLEGKIPKDLQGVFYRNGPGKHERGDMRYKHLFEGDGMLQRFDIADGKIIHHGKFIGTPKFKTEQKAEQFLYSGPDTKLANSLPVSSSDMVNTANTNVIPVGDDLWALWEAGSPAVIDSDTLEFKQFEALGKDTKYTNSLKGLPFSAHPKISPDGDIWNFGLGPAGHIVLYHLAANGTVKNVGVINAQYNGGMLHDFLMTDKHLLIILPSIVADRSIQGYFAGTQFDQNVAMTVLVVSKQSLAIKSRVELPPGFAFHYGNAWEDIDGTIHFDASLYPDLDVLHKLSDVMQGQMSHVNSRARTAFYTIKNNGTYDMQILDSISEFPRVSDHVVGLKNDYLYHLSANQNSFWSDTVSSINTDTGKEQHFHFGEDYLVEEHVSVCPKQKQGTGYLIGTALHVPSKRTCLNIFDVSNLGQGPICRAWLPYHLPLGFHGNFKIKQS